MNRSHRPAPALFAAALVALAAALAPPPAASQRVLFDARHGQTAGNADWIVDADSSELVFLDFRCRRTSRHHSGQRFPTPPQASIGPDTPETVWDGGISAWAVALAKDALDPARGRDWTIEQYPWDAPEMTFGDPTNPQDLANYDVLVLCEPNLLFTDAEAQAVREFVASGGGLFLCADHETSDRNCSGGTAEVHDSPFILNRLMQTDVATRRDPPYFDPLDPTNDFGVFGIWFYENDNDDPDDPENRRFDWFSEPVNDNVSTDPDDPLVRGPFGDGSGGLGFFGATQMAVSVDPERGNPTARAHVWRNGAPHAANAVGVSERVTFASARFGAGRVVAIGDSSPADDGTGEGNLHDGWDKASGGVANHVLFLNATEWLAAAAPDETAPTITAGPAVAATDCSATVTWVTDEPATSEVEWGETAALGRRAERTGFATGHSVRLDGLEPGSRHFVRVGSSDPAGNGPTTSGVTSFDTAEPLALTLGDATATADRPGTILAAWRTNKPARSRAEAAPVEGGPVAATASSDATGTEHALRLDGLAPETEYWVWVVSTDACGANAEEVLTVTTPPAPASRDLSGWRLESDHPTIAFTFPAGTEIPAGGVLVLGRANDRAGFESEWGLLDPEVLYLSADDGLVINATARAFRLLDDRGEVVDGPTVAVGKGRSFGRLDACLPAAAAPAWEDRPRSAADPGRGLPAACGADVVVTEISDAGDFRNEFVEIVFDPD